MDLRKIAGFWFIFSLFASFILNCSLFSFFCLCGLKFTIRILVFPFAFHWTVFTFFLFQMKRHYDGCSYHHHRFYLTYFGVLILGVQTLEIAICFLKYWLFIIAQYSLFLVTFHAVESVFSEVNIACFFFLIRVSII